MPTDDRDRVVDQLLRTSAGGLLAVPGPDCLDAETLAAWHEGGLDRTMARQVDAHLATCARCQAMAGAFVRADVTTPAPARSAWGLRWLVPVAVTAAAAAAIWVLVPRSSGSLGTDQTVAMNEPSVPATPGSTNRERLPAAAPAANAEGGAAPVADPERTASKASNAAAPVPSAASSTDERASQAAKAEAAAPGALRDEPAPAPPRPAPPPMAPVAVPAPAPAPQVPPQRESVQVTAEAPLIQAQSGERSVTVSTTQSSFIGVAAAAPAGAPGDAASRETRVGGAGQNIQMDAISAIDIGSAARVVAEFAAPAAPPAIGGAEPPPAFAGAVRSAGLEERTPTRWRVLADGRVQRSLTGGGSWDAMAIDSALHVTTGSAPSPMVCWLVGPRGVVLHTSDRLHFQRLAFPETVDLSAIQAMSDLAATVTTGDGRTFATADGGKTWRAGAR